MKRPEAWHEAYKAIYDQFGCIRLTVEQAATLMGMTAKRVTQKYPDGWSNQGRGKTIRIDTLLDQEFNCY